MHGGKWRVTLAVPRALHERLGTRLKRPLHTDSLAVANHLKLRVVEEFRATIARELETSGLLPRPAIETALLFREQLRHAVGSASEYALADAHREIARLATDILGPQTGLERDEETGGSYPIYDPKRSDLADDFLAVARGAATPFLSTTPRISKRAL